MFVPATVNVVVPQPLTTTAPSVPNTNDGNTNAILSPIEKTAFNANMNDTDDGADVTAFEITKELNINAGVGCTTALEDAIDVVAAIMSAADASITPTFRSLRFAACAFALVVTPVDTVTVHSEPDNNVADEAVRVNVHVDVPDPVPDTLNEVLPHPLDIVGDAREPNLNVGNTSVMVSDTSSGAFITNV